MRLTVLNPNAASVRGHWMEAHRTGCAHLNLRRDGIRSDHACWELDADTLEEAARIIGADFIDEGSMTLADCVREIHFAPCVKLPKSS